MAVEFRQRTPSEYIRITWKRKWMILLPAFAVATAVAAVVWQLPDVYESSTLIVVKQGTLPAGVIPQVSDDNLTRQLAGITQVVTSRSSLEPLIKKYDLYRTERLRGEPMESVIQLMQNAIRVEVNTSRNDITNGFNIAFRGRDPRSTQGVAAELASKYIDENTKDKISASKSAKEFIDQQVRQVADELKAIDDRKLAETTKNIGNLPSEQGSLLGQLTGLREQQKTYITELGRAQDRRSALSGQLTLLRQQTRIMIDDLSKNITDPKTTMAWAQLATRRADLEAQLTTLEQTYTRKHPDVLAKRAELESVKKSMDEMVADRQARIEEEKKKLQDRPDVASANVEAEIKLLDGEIKRQQDQLAQSEQQIGEIMKRINSVPGAEVALATIDREYQTKKAAYDALLIQQQKISLNADADSQSQSGGIQVIDPANLPMRPTAPKRGTLTALGLGLGLAIGVVFAGIFEVPKLFTIQTTDDAAHYTNLPVLISVPELLTPKEASAIPMRRRLLFVGALIATVVSIPALFVALKATHIFERFVS